MNETCDRCGPTVRVVYSADRNGELYLCRHCTNRLWPALSAQCWTIWPASEHTLALQATWRADREPKRAEGKEYRHVQVNIHLNCQTQA
jgi:hypothetical protein